MFSQLQDHQLFEEAVAHHELLGGARNVPVVVQDPHACETGNVHLDCDVASHVDVSLCFTSWVSTDSLGSAPVVKALVSNFVNHNYNIIKYTN